MASVSILAYSNQSSKTIGLAHASHCSWSACPAPGRIMIDTAATKKTVGSSAISAPNSAKIGSDVYRRRCARGTDWRTRASMLIA